MKMETIRTEQTTVDTLVAADAAIRSWNEINDRKNGYNNSRYQTGNWSDWDCLRNIDISLRRIADALANQQLAQAVEKAEAMR